MGYVTSLLFKTFGLLILVPSILFVFVALFDDQTEISVALVFLVTSAFGWYLYTRPKVSRLKKEAKIKSLSEFSGVDYSHVFADTGIALSKAASTVFLISGDKKKLYSFEDIRKWRYVFKDGGVSSDDSLARRGGIEARNASESGFFVQVKDIDNPEWHIKFDYNNHTETELKRWMEIFNQIVNKN